MEQQTGHILSTNKKGRIQIYERNMGELVEDVHAQPGQPRRRITINQPDQMLSTPEQERAQEEAAIQQEQLIQVKRTYCYNKFNRMQCFFLIIGILTITAGCITLGILLGRRWVEKSFTTQLKPIYQTSFVTPTGNQVVTLKLTIGQQHILKDYTTDTLYVTTINSPTINGRGMQQSQGTAAVGYNPAGFVTVSEGSITAKAANSEDVKLLVNVQALDSELEVSVSGRLLEEVDSKEQLFQLIKKIVAQRAGVDADQVSVKVKTYVRLVDNGKGQLVAEEIDPRRDLAQTKVVAKAEENKTSTTTDEAITDNATSENNATNDKSLTDKKNETATEKKTAPAIDNKTDASTDKKSTQTKADKNATKKEKKEAKDQNILKKAAKLIGNFFESVRAKLKKHEKRIEETAKCQFKTTNDIKFSIDVEKQIGKNHILITREYKDGLDRKSKQIKNTLVISAEEFEAIKHCFQNADGKFCEKKFIDRVDNPFKLSDESRNRADLHKLYIFYEITIHDKDEKKDTKQHEKHKHAVIGEPDAKQGEDVEKVDNSTLSSQTSTKQNKNESTNGTKPSL